MAVYACRKSSSLAVVSSLPNSSVCAAPGCGIDSVTDVMAPASTLPSTAVATRRFSLPSSYGIGGPTCMPSARGDVAFNDTDSVCGAPGGTPTVLVVCLPFEAISTISVTGHGMPFCTRSRIAPYAGQLQLPCFGAITNDGAAEG